MISAEKEQALRQRMDSLGIREDDLVEKFVLGSGSGGQKINKTHSCVYLKHEPTGLEVKCQRDRSRTMNRHYARAELCDQLQAKRDAKSQERKQEREKKKRQKRRPSAAARKRNVEKKRRRGEVKKMRRKPIVD